MSVLTQQRHSPSEPGTILAVEDNASDRRLLEEAFAETDGDTELDLVADGESALDTLHRRTGRTTAELPDLVLTDLNLPGRDGEAILEAIRDDPQLQGLPVVVFSRSDAEPDVKRCYQAGADAYLVKPIGFDELVALVEQIESFWLRRATPS